MDNATLQIILTAEGALVTAAIAYGAERWRRWTGSQINTNDQQLLEAAAMNGIARGQEKLIAGESVKGIVGDAVTYVRTMLPGITAKGDRNKETPSDWLEQFVSAVAAKVVTSPAPGPSHSDMLDMAIDAAKTGKVTIPAGVVLSAPVTVAPVVPSPTPTPQVGQAQAQPVAQQPAAIHPADFGGVPGTALP